MEDYSGIPMMGGGGFAGMSPAQWSGGVSSVAGDEASAWPTSPSQVPGTSGSPQGYTPSAYGGTSGGGVSTGNAGSPYGNLAGQTGMGGAPTGAAPAGGNPMSPQQRMNMLGRAGMSLLQNRGLQPPGSPLRPGAPAPVLSAAGGNPMIEQLKRMYGLDDEGARRLLAMIQPGGGTAMNPAQQSQMLYPSTPMFAPPSQMSLPQTSLLPASAMPTPANPYGVPRMTGPAQTAMLPQLGQGAFMPPGAANPTQSTIFGSYA